MNLIARITDKEIGEDIVKYEKKLTRLASRGIVLNGNDEIAIFYKKIKMNISCLVEELKKQKLKKNVLKEKY